jgi:hypothetical protein
MSVPLSCDNVVAEIREGKRMMGGMKIYNTKSGHMCCNSSKSYNSCTLPCYHRDFFGVFRNKLLFYKRKQPKIFFYMIQSKTKISKAKILFYLPKLLQMGHDH